MKNLTSNRSFAFWAS